MHVARQQRQQRGLVGAVMHLLDGAQQLPFRDPLNEWVATVVVPLSKSVSPGRCVEQNSHMTPWTALHHRVKLVQRPLKLVRGNF